MTDDTLDDGSEENQKERNSMTSALPLSSPPSSTASMLSSNNENTLHASREKNDAQLPKALMLYDFDAQEKNELAATEGQELLIVHVYPDGWTLCEELNGSTTRRRGLVPTEYYEKKMVPKVERKSVRYSIRPALQASIKTMPIVGMLNLSALHSHASGEPGKLDLGADTLNSSRVFESKKKQANRNSIRSEILSTERTYVHGLKVMKQYFIDPICSQNLVPSSVYRTLFPTDIEIITEVNSTFLAYLEKIITSIPDVEFDQLVSSEAPVPLEEVDLSVPLLTPKKSFKIDPTQNQSTQLANLLLHYAHSFKLYSDYINKYNRIADAFREEVKKNKKFKTFLDQQKVKLKNDGERMANLPDYMITPVQRLPRYKLLFEDLLKNTEPSHDSYKKLKQAILLVSGIAKFCNDKGNELVNQTLLLSIQQRLKLKDFLVPNRKLLVAYCDNLAIQYYKSNTGGYKECDFFLLSDMFIIIPKGKRRFSWNQKERYILQYIKKKWTEERGDVKEVKLEVYANTVTIETEYTKDNNHRSSQRNGILCKNEEQTTKVVKFIQSIIGQ